MTGWDSLVGEPLARFTGPFPTRPFLEICARHSADEVVVLAGAASAAALAVDGPAIRFAGAAHLTDYHSPLGSDMLELARAIGELAGDRVCDLDSMPAEAAVSLADGFVRAGRRAVATDDESCQVLDLAGASPSGWEALLGSKERHELRRKRRRYTEAYGDVDVASGADYLDRFVALHRASSGDKAGFMTEEMEAFFRELLTLPQARLDVLRDGDTVLAAAFGFDDSEAYYLYNSAFDRAALDVSPGIVLIDALIGRSVERGQERFDFLKGSESYKRRFGAGRRRLVRLEVFP